MYAVNSSLSNTHKPLYSRVVPLNAPDFVTLSGDYGGQVTDPDEVAEVAAVSFFVFQSSSSTSRTFTALVNVTMNYHQG